MEKEVKSCSKCYQERIGKGISHTCTEANRKKNLAEFVKKGEGSEQIAAEVLKDIVAKKKVEEDESVKLEQLKGGNLLTVHNGLTGGQKLKNFNPALTEKLRRC